MKTVKHTRLLLGLSQRDLAQYLGIARTRLMKTEKGDCGLSTVALFKLAYIEKRILTATPADAAKKVATCTKSTRDFCTRRALNCRYKLAVLKRRRDAMEFTYNRVMRLQQLLQILETETGGSNNPWILLQKQKAEKTLQACSPTWLSELHAKIYLLTAEADSIDLYLKQQDPSLNNQRLLTI
jgi:transcriptional regulator with XRE-family HTH domain